MKRETIPARYAGMAAAWPELTLCRIIAQERGLYTIDSENGIRTAAVSGKFQHEALTVSDFRKVKATLIDWIAQRPDDGEYALDLLMIAKYFERIGDHATNIAEWVVFAVTGVHNGEELT